MKIIKKILNLTDKSQNKKLIFLLLSIVFVGLIEMTGVAMIVPFLAVISNPELSQTNAILHSIYAAFSFSSTKSFMLFLGGLVFLTIILGNIFASITSWSMLSYCFNQGKALSCKLLAKYISQPYVFFLNRHSSDLINIMLSEVDRMTTGVFINVMQCISKAVLMICILSLLIIVEPLLASTVIVVLGGAYIITYRIIRNKISNAGRIASETNHSRIQLINEVIGAIKEVKIIGQESNFLNYYEEKATEYARAETICQVFPVATKYMIEAIAFGGMLLIALYLIWTKENFNNFVPLLGLYALAGYRLMPAMQHLFNGLTVLRYNLAPMETLQREMKLIDVKFHKRNTSVLEFKNSIELKNISYQYPNSQNNAIDDFNLIIKKNSTIGIVGSSGAGKTTLVDIVLGLLEPNDGKIIVDGAEVSQKNITLWQHSIGYVPQSIFLLDTSVAGNIALGVNLEEINMEAVIKAARLANIHDFVINDLPNGYDTMLGERGIRISGGQRQRIAIARALYNDPALLIFDEATSALDGVTEKVIMEAIKSLSHQKTIVLIAHRLNTVKDCDLICVLSKGEVVGQGHYKELLDTNRAFQQLANAH